MNNKLQSVLNNVVIEGTARWILGLIFIYASFHKIAAPAEFAKAVYGYGLFPNEIINLIAIIVPFVELFAGLALISGAWVRSAALIIFGLLILFILLISINLIRGHEFDCGCFAPGDLFSAKTPWQTLGRDLVLFLLAWHVVTYRARHPHRRISDTHNA